MLAEGQLRQIQVNPSDTPSHQNHTFIHVTAMNNRTHLSCIRSHLLFGFNPVFCRIAIDPDTQTVAFTDGHKVFVQRITSSQPPNLLHNNQKLSLAISHSQNITAALYRHDTSVYTLVENSTASEHRFLQHSPTSFPRDCKLAPNAAFIAALYTDQGSGSSTVVVFDPKNSSLISKWTIPFRIFFIELPADALFIFVLQYSPGGWFIRKHGLYNGEHHSSIQVFPGPKHTRCLSGFSCDAKAHNVVIADTNSLRIWQPQTSDSTTYHLPGYTSVDPFHHERHFVLEILPCAISRDGSRVVAAVAGNSLGIWDTTRRTRIATVAGDTYSPLKCAISTDGTTLFAVGADRKFCQWAMPTETTTTSFTTGTETSPSTLQTTTNSSPLPATSNPSPLETALVDALHNPAQLNESFLLTYIRSTNINSVSDLLSGHNLVLLAIRTRVITRDNIQRLGNSTWYLRDNLYHPASKLASGHTPFIDIIFQHAENVGIISDGYPFKIGRSIRTDTNDGKRKLARFLVSWLGNVDQRMRALEVRASTVEENINWAVTSISAEQQSLENAVRRLSESLDNLQAAFKKKDKITKRVQIARCLLSFIPLVGKALGETAYTMTDVIMGLKWEDLIPPVVDTTNAMLTGMFPVDLSNFQVANIAFSNETLSKLKAPARNAVTTAIEESGFQSSEQLQRILGDEVKSIEEIDPSMALLDVGSSKWLTVQDGSSKFSPFVDSPYREEGVRNFFKWKTHASKDRTMSIEEAKGAVNIHLGTQKLSPVTPEKLENLFFELASEDAEEVDEGVFVKMVLAVMKEHDASNEMKKLLDECAKRFEMRARPGKSLSMRFAARLVCNISKEMENQGIVQQAPMEYDHILEGLQQFDSNESGSIETEEFLEAVKALLKGDRAMSRRSTEKCTRQEGNAL